MIGGGDWSADRLLPDAVRAWSAQTPLQVRHPDAIRPWQHVLQPLHAYLRLVECLWQQPALASAYNSGPGADQCCTVRELLELARAAYGTGEIRYETQPGGVHEAGVLLLDSHKIRAVISPQSVWSLGQAVSRSMAWYRAQHDGGSAATLCGRDISEFESMQGAAAQEVTRG